MKGPAARFWIPLAWGLTVGTATFALLDLAKFFPPASFRRYLELPFMILVGPGLLAGIAIGKNIHAFSLIPAAITNFGVQFFIARSVGKLISRKVYATRDKSAKLTAARN